MWLFGLGVAHFFEQGDDSVAKIALDDDLTVFGAAAYTTFAFEGFVQEGHVVGGAHKVIDHCDGFAPTPAALHAHTQFLLLGWEGVDDGVFVFVLVLKVGVGGIDHSGFVFCHVVCVWCGLDLIFDQLVDGLFDGVGSVADDEGLFHVTL